MSALCVIPCLSNFQEKTEEERQKEIETEREKQDYRKKILNADTNQKLGLLRAAIRLGDWATTSSILAFLPPFLPAWCETIAQSFFQLLHYLLDPLYRRCVCVCACTCTMRACMHACVLYMCVYVQAVHSLGFAHRANFSSRYRTEYSTPCHIILYAILFTAMLQRLPNPVIHPSLRNSAPLVTNSPISPLTSSRF